MRRISLLSAGCPTLTERSSRRRVGFFVRSAPIRAILTGPGRQAAGCPTLEYAFDMSKMIQLRNVPDALHRRLKARAAMAGMSLSDYLLAEIKEIAERPTLAELRQRLHQRKAVSAELATVRLVQEERESR